MATVTILKRGNCGDIVCETTAGRRVVIRDLGTARRGFRWLARLLARKEAAALTRLRDIDGIPTLIAVENDRVVRSFVPGLPMHEFRPDAHIWFRNALALLRRMHRQGVAHNDLAKEANWICRPDGDAGIVDFQLAVCFHRRSRRFRRLAREDLRHLMKHKACYLPDRLTQRQRTLLANPSLPARAWRGLFKPVYRWVTRSLLGWPERTGPAERERPI